MSEKFVDATEDVKFKKLRKFNFLMGCLHLFQAVLMLAIANWAVKMTIISTYLHFPGPGMAPVPEIQVMGSVPLGPMVAMFLLMSAVAHFLISSPWGYPWYVKNLKLNMNKARWFEYAISSSFMLVVIAWLCGVWDLGTIILLFSVNACMNLFGYMMELHNQTTKKTDWTAYYFGCFAGLMPWVVLLMFFFGASSASGSIPTFVYFILISIAVFFNIFAVNMVLQYKKVGKWKDYLYGEYVYIVLSLVAKSLLAWQVFAGTLRG